MVTGAAGRGSEADMAREEARRLLARSKLPVDRNQRRLLLARALELAVHAEQMDRGKSLDTEVDRSGRAASAVA
jgi:hypothetical protein